MSATLRVVHAGAPGRVRYRSEAFLRNPELAAWAEAVLATLPGVRSAEVRVRTGWVLVWFEPLVQREVFEALMCDALGTTLAAPDPRRVTRVSAGVTRLGLGALALTRSTADRVKRGRDVLERIRTLLRGPADEEPGDAKHPVQAEIEDVPYHALSVEQVCVTICVASAHGHTSYEAVSRLAIEGRNSIAPPELRSKLRILLDQLANTPVALLGVSALLSVATGGIGDALAILAVVALNATIGYVTETRAERTIAALTHTRCPRAGTA